MAFLGEPRRGAFEQKVQGEVCAKQNTGPKKKPRRNGAKMVHSNLTSASYDLWNSDRFETSVVRSFIQVPTGPSVRGLVFAAHARMVTACQIWLNCRESARHFKEIFCDNISEFRVSRPQPRSPSPMRHIWKSQPELKSTKSRLTHDTFSTNLTSQPTLTVHSSGTAKTSSSAVRIGSIWMIALSSW